MKVPYSINTESSESILNTLMMRHKSDLVYYRGASEQVKDNGLSDFLKSLVHYREELYDQLRPILESMPSGPVTPSRATRSFLDDQPQVLFTAAESNNRSQLSQLIQETEKATSDYYRQALDNNRLVANVRAIIEAQHQRILEVERKVSRMHRVPAQRNNQFG